MNLILLHALLSLAPGQASPSLLSWLPAETRSVVVVSDFRQAVQGYQSPESQQSIELFQQRFAILPKELAELADGQFLRAEWMGTADTHHEVVIAHAADGVEATIKNLHARLKQQGAQVRVASFGSHEGHLIARRRADGTERVSVHLIRAGHIVLADSVAAAELIAAQEAPGSGGLVQQQRFAQVWQKSADKLRGDDLAIVWYTDPWMRVQGQPAAQPEETPEDERVEFAKRHGLNGIVAVGGNIVIGEANAQTVEAFALAPPPLASSLQMATHLQGTKELVLPQWVSQSVTDAVVLQGNIGKALEHAGLLFDDSFAEGVEGTYDEVLLDLQDVLELDIKKELYPLLGPRMYLLNGAMKDRQWQPLVVAFEVKNAQRVAEIIRILIADDPEATEVVLAGESDRLWHVPGERGGRDFVLGMLKGVAVYANDFEFAKKAMRFDQSPPLLSENQFMALRNQIMQGRDAQPSILIVRNLESEDQGASAQPLDLVFQGADFFADREGPDETPMSWLPSGMGMLRHRLVVGFYERDGWKFVTRTAAQTREDQDDR